MIAYFSMEICVAPDVPTSAGGLGVLAGDMVRAAADKGLPFVAVTLIHRQGYFRQRLDETGHQREESSAWDVAAHLEPLAPRITLTVNGRPVVVRAWRRQVAGVDGTTVPVYFLDTDFGANAVEDRALSHALYGGDCGYRLAQETVLGVGGVRMLRALGYADVQRFHLNEGHSALLVLELLTERLGSRTAVTDDDIESVRRSCVFTTHTPIQAAHDQFPLALARRVVGQAPITEVLHRCCYAGVLNMTYLALTSASVLEQTVLPLFYQRHDAFVDVMRHAIALNGSFFTAQRMLEEYALKAYAP